jgi:hypothetical protein
MLQINEAICSETGQFFVYTDNANQRKQATLKTDSLDDADYYVDKKIESLMFFRNITKISEEGKIICPHCNKVHDS